MDPHVAGTAAAPADRRTPPPVGTPSAPPPSAPPPEEPWAAILAGLREAVVVVGRGGVVRTCNEPARALLPGLVVGELVDSAGWAPFTGAVRGPADRFEADLDAPADGDGPRRVVGRRRALPDGWCWYLLDVTDEHARADSLLSAQARAQFLAEAGRAMHGVLHLDRTLRTVASLAVGRLAAAALVLAADGSDSVRWARHDTCGARPRGGTLPVARVREAPRLHEALTSAATEAESDPWITVELADLGLWPADGAGAGRTTVVGIPSGGVVRAVLVLAEHDAGETAPGDAPDGVVVDTPDPELVDEYASRAGAALSAAALYREQSHLGAVLQESLAPPELPAVPGVDLGAVYRPAREGLRVGGDFYEVLAPADPTDPGAPTGFLLGDVCGKGIEAAVLSGRVRQSLHALRLVERRPAALLGLLNTALLDAAASYGEVSRFATLVLGDAWTEPDGSLRLRLATGGHPPPMVLHTDGTVREVDLAGTLVGALRDGSFTETEVRLAPGETCLIYSDGVTEARGGAAGAEFYGEGRLAAALATCAGAPAQVMCERLLQLLSGWLDGRDHDDVALLAVRAPSAPSSAPWGAR